MLMAEWKSSVRAFIIRVSPVLQARILDGWEIESVDVLFLLQHLSASVKAQPQSTMGGVVVDDGAPGVKAPDGGWGWAVLVGCFVITGFSYAFPKAVSVFFKELIREFGVGYSDTAWISSILLAMLYGTGKLLLVYTTHK